MNVEVLADSQALAQRAVDLLVAAAASAIEERGKFVLAVSGGSTPRLMLELLSERDDLDWSRTHLFQVDERVAPDGDSDRNATMLDTALLTDSFLSRHTPAGIHLMPVNADDLDAATVAVSYTHLTLPTKA